MGPLDLLLSPWQTGFQMASDAWTLTGLGGKPTLEKKANVAMTYLPFAPISAADVRLVQARTKGAIIAQKKSSPELKAKWEGKTITAPWGDTGISEPDIPNPADVLGDITKWILPAVLIIGGLWAYSILKK